jgi:hypothetical protein
MIKVNNKRIDRIYQGDILRDVEFLESYAISENEINITKILFPLVIVLTQDCDLQQDATFRRSQRSTQDKYLISVLVAPMYNAEHFFKGEHLIDLGMNMQQINRNKTPGENIINNETPRYHFLSFPEDVPLPATIIDFKHYFSVNLSYLNSIKAKNCVCQVSELYREEVSQRFANFLSRIGLPTINENCKM